jgi:3-deoxy-manno-octulosonate cytidylyltransferase (CMP-KDO synthetase)
MHACIIPARMGSSRFPGKPLAKLLNLPMLAHVVERCQMEKVFDVVYVATCDAAIADLCRSLSYRFVMTSEKHERASDRVQEAAEKIESSMGSRFSTVTLVQGDEPLVTPNMLRFALEGLKSSGAPVVNLRSPILEESEFESSNCVKVVVDRNDYALYFSRAMIPDASKYNGEVRPFKQVCVIPFDRKFLDVYSSLEPTPLEIIESVDMNRVIEHGFKLFCPEIAEQSYPVDIPEDVERAERLLKMCPLTNRYMNI